MMQPRAMQRVGKSIFVPQRARRLLPEEYDIVYVDSAYFGNRDHQTIQKQIRDLAIILDNRNASPSEIVTTYADRQKDKTDIGLTGNQGSGRAVYYRDKFNILGVGKTTLCKSTIPSHSTGKLELIGAMRRIILSRWINYFTRRAPLHPLLIALKETVTVKWNPNPVPVGLLVRIDGGDLDRPSHVEQSPEIPVDLKKVITQYARLDAECFAYRILQGAWSTSNYSLQGHLIDLESASFVKYRGPSYTSSAKYPHNRFGYEGLGLLRVLRQLARVKKRGGEETAQRFYRERSAHLGRSLLSLLGVPDDLACPFFSKYQNRIINLSHQFERLSKKINNQIMSSNLYTPLPDEQDPSLLDMSNLFRNLAKLYSSSNEAGAFEHLIRKEALSHLEPGATNMPQNQTEAFIRGRAVVTCDRVDSFLAETRNFIHGLFQLLTSLDREKCLDKKKDWDRRLHAVNQNLPPMCALNKKLKSLAESYRLGVISPKTLGAEIDALCELPNRKYAKAVGARKSNCLNF